MSIDEGFIKLSEALLNLLGHIDRQSFRTGF